LCSSPPTGLASISTPFRLAKSAYNGQY
jgi:hypothetical protein